MKSSKDTAPTIHDCLLADQYRLRREQASLARKYDAATATKLASRIRTSAQAVHSRRASIPPVTLTPGLPISEKRDLIAAALEKYQIVIVAGETGSGKTTQIPKICLQLGYGAKGLIGHTQPRRLAARSVAARIAEELGEPLGKGVGYQVRFTDNTGAGTWIKLMTDGILLAEIQQDRFLNKYEVLIIDEAHERSLNIDFLLGYLKQLTARRPDLKIIVTSATIDVDKFSEHFNGAPVISVSGRSFPVEIVYQPLSADEGNAEEDPAERASEDLLTAGVINAVHGIEEREKKEKRRPGDVLVFVSGEREIRDLAAGLRQEDFRNTEVLPLYARLSHAEQQRIFAPHTGRRIILSTNVAETSLTVPGIIYVIDTGLARISRYSVQSKVQRLPIERISQASANQRAGRCGRIASGVCIRLYSEEDFNSRPAFTEPEIQRTNLSAVILQMLMLRLGDIADFPFVDRPETRAINEGFALLQELGAIDRSRVLTPAGRSMANLPTDPRLASMLIEGAQRQCLHELLIIVSALSVQDPRDVPPEKRQAAREKHKIYSHAESDFMSWVSLWENFESQRQELTQNALRQYCRQNYLSFLRMREWRETHRQLSLACQQLGLRFFPSGPVQVTQARESYEAIHRSILRGSLNQIGLKSEDNFYVGARGRKFVLLPTSVLYRKMPRWIVAASLIETHRVFASMAARIEPLWVAEAAEHLVRREHFEAHWEKKRGQVIAFEKVVLYGLTLIERQRIDFSKTDPVLSREIFLREALVGQQLDTRAAFYQRNNALIAEIRLQEEKQRRPDILVSDDQLYAFYAERIPEGICDSRSFETWRKKVEATAPETLLMRPEDLVQRGVDDAVITEFPDHADIGGNRLKINYRFAPGTSEDGACIDMPLALLPNVGELELEWAVPGQIRERCIAMIRALPKSLRKQFIPIPDFVDAALQNAQPGRERLSEVISRHAARKGIQLDKEQWLSIATDPQTLPAHLRTRIRVLDDQGREVDSDESLAPLQHRLGTNAAKSAEADVHPLERSGLREWSFDELPHEVSIDKGIRIIRYPALVDAVDSVSIHLVATPLQARNLSRLGVMRLLMFRTAQQRTAIQKTLQQLERKAALKMPQGLGDTIADGVTAVYAEAFDLTGELPRNQKQFEARLNTGKSQLLSTADELVRLLEQIYDHLFQLRRRLASARAGSPASLLDDIDTQLSAMVYPGFLAGTPWQWLRQYPRYFRAIDARLEKYPQQPAKDQESQTAIQDLHAQWQRKRSLSSEPDADIFTEFPWLLQELRVSLFAQTLKTLTPVSVQRLQKRVGSML